MCVCDVTRPNFQTKTKRGRGEKNEPASPGGVPSTKHEGVNEGRSLEAEGVSMWRGVTKGQIPNEIKKKKLESARGGGRGVAGHDESRLACLGKDTDRLRDCFVTNRALAGSC